MMPFNLKTREMRKRLEVREKPYYVRVTSSTHLGYRKSKWAVPPVAQPARLK